LEVPIYSRKPHCVFTIMKFSMQFLPTQFISTVLEFIEQMLLSFSDFRLACTH